MKTIYDHWRDIIATVATPVVVEVGVHHGTSTLNLRACVTAAGKRMGWLGLEPDPRNAARCRELGLDVIEAAASDTKGVTDFWLSSGYTPGYSARLHTDSSSIHRPTKHLDRYPWCRFASKITVQTVRLDDIVPPEPVTLIWADVQGAQRKMLAGSRELLTRTDCLYIECPGEPMYEGETTFEELCGLLPGWRVVERWSDDVLFRRVA